MPFQAAERVIYSKNTLVEVVCQLRFPRILSINEKAPADFQERIRSIYPLLEEQTEQEQQYAFEAGMGEAPAMPRFVQAESNKNYAFSTEDSNWRINLTSRFIALSTRKYTKWEEFREHLQTPVQALLDIYKPAFFERVGLRYINAINRENLGLVDTQWHELIQPFALGFLSNKDVCDEVKGYSSSSELTIEGDSVARINTTLGFVNGVSKELSETLSFIVDSDLFHGKTSVDEYTDVLEVLHGTSTKLIRAIVTDKLHKSMEPNKI